MLAKVCSAAVNGIEAYPVEVEVNAGYGDTIIVIVVNVAPKQQKLFFFQAFLNPSRGFRGGDRHSRGLTTRQLASTSTL